MVRRIAMVLAALGMSVATTGCFVDAGTTSTVVPVGTGAVTLRWSIDGSFDPAACDAFFVADARIDLYDVNGTPIRTQFIDCRQFSARFDLPEGRYSARVEMTDAAQQPRSTSLPVQSFVIVAGSNLNIDTDFPRDSFF